MVWKRAAIFGKFFTINLEVWPCPLIWRWAFVSSYFKYLQLMKGLWTEQSVLGQFIVFFLTLKCDFWPSHTVFLNTSWTLRTKHTVIVRTRCFRPIFHNWPWSMTLTFNLATWFLCSMMWTCNKRIIYRPDKLFHHIWPLPSAHHG